MSKLRVHKFTDYRSFLLAHVQDKRKENPNWTFGIWARSLGLKDPSSITKILQGQRHPGKQITERLVNYFNFKNNEGQYFSDLVAFHKVKDDPRLSVMLLEKMGKQNPDLSSRVLDDKTFSLISNWYCFAIREMVRLDRFFENPDWISKTFHFKVTPKEAERALALLIEVGLLVRSDTGKLAIQTGLFKTKNDFANEALKRFHESSLENAKLAIRSIDVAEREITASVFAMKRSSIPRAKELIREFKDKFESLLEEDDADGVYQVNIQFYPLTKLSKLSPSKELE
jgi:uncharacterized protein (TIGR02147 family)